MSTAAPHHALLPTPGRHGNTLVVAMGILASVAVVLALSTNSAVNSLVSSNQARMGEQALAAVEAVLARREAMVTELGELGDPAEFTRWHAYNFSDGGSGQENFGVDFFNGCEVRWKIEPMRTVKGTDPGMPNSALPFITNPSPKSSYTPDTATTHEQPNEYAYLFQVSAEARVLRNDALDDYGPENILARAQGVRYTAINKAPLFRYVIFYAQEGAKGDLEFSHGDTVNVAGNVHSNGAIYFGSSTLVNNWSARRNDSAYTRIGPDNDGNPVIVTGVDGIFRLSKQLMFTGINGFPATGTVAGFDANQSYAWDDPLPFPGDRTPVNTSSLMAATQNGTSINPYRVTYRDGYITDRSSGTDNHFTINKDSDGNRIPLVGKGLKANDSRDHDRTGTDPLWAVSSPKSTSATADRPGFGGYARTGVTNGRVITLPEKMSNRPLEAQRLAYVSANPVPEESVQPMFVTNAGTATTTLPATSAPVVEAPGSYMADALGGSGRYLRRIDGKSPSLSTALTYGTGSDRIGTGWVVTDAGGNPITTQPDKVGLVIRERPVPDTRQWPGDTALASSFVDFSSPHYLPYAYGKHWRPGGFPFYHIDVVDELNQGAKDILVNVSPKQTWNRWSSNEEHHAVRYLQNGSLLLRTAQAEGENDIATYDDPYDNDGMNSSTLPVQSPLCFWSRKPRFHADNWRFVHLKKPTPATSTPYVERYYFRSPLDPNSGSVNAVTDMQGNVPTRGKDASGPASLFMGMPVPYQSYTTNPSYPLGLYSAFNTLTTINQTNPFGTSTAYNSSPINSPYGFTSSSTNRTWYAQKNLLYSVRFTGFVTPTLGEGAYEFDVSSDDGGRVWIDNQLVASYWAAKGESLASSNLYPKRNRSVNLRPGSYYSFTVEVEQGYGGMAAKLYWRKAGSGNFTLVPLAAFRATAPYHTSITALPTTADNDTNMRNPWYGTPRVTDSPLMFGFDKSRFRQVTAKVEVAPGAPSTAKVGLMIRDGGSGLSPLRNGRDPYVAMLYSPTRGFFSQRRLQPAVPVRSGVLDPAYFIGAGTYTSRTDPSQTPDVSASGGFAYNTFGNQTRLMTADYINYTVDDLSNGPTQTLAPSTSTRIPSGGQSVDDSGLINHGYLADGDGGFYGPIITGTRKLRQKIQPTAHPGYESASIGKRWTLTFSLTGLPASYLTTWTGLAGFPTLLFANASSSPELGFASLENPTSTGFKLSDTAIYNVNTSSGDNWVDWGPEWDSGEITFGSPSTFWGTPTHVDSSYVTPKAPVYSMSVIATLLTTHFGTPMVHGGALPTWSHPAVNPSPTNPLTYTAGYPVNSAVMPTVSSVTVDNMNNAFLKALVKGTATQTTGFTPAIDRSIRRSATFDLNPYITAWGRWFETVTGNPVTERWNKANLVKPYNPASASPQSVKLGLPPFSYFPDFSQVFYDDLVGGIRLSAMTPVTGAWPYYSGGAPTIDWKDMDITTAFFVENSISHANRNTVAFNPATGKAINLPASLPWNAYWTPTQWPTPQSHLKPIPAPPTGSLRPDLWYPQEGGGFTPISDIPPDPGASALTYLGSSLRSLLPTATSAGRWLDDHPLNGLPSGPNFFVRLRKDPGTNTVHFLYYSGTSENPVDADFTQLFMHDMSVYPTDPSKWTPSTADITCFSNQLLIGPCAQSGDANIPVEVVFSSLKVEMDDNTVPALDSQYQVIDANDWDQVPGDNIRPNDRYLASQYQVLWGIHDITEDFFTWRRDGDADEMIASEDWIYQPREFWSQSNVWPYGFSPTSDPATFGDTSQVPSAYQAKDSSATDLTQRTLTGKTTLLSLNLANLQAYLRSRSLMEAATPAITGGTSPTTSTTTLKDQFNGLIYAARTNRYPWNPTPGAVNPWDIALDGGSKALPNSGTSSSVVSNGRRLNLVTDSELFFGGVHKLQPYKLANAPAFKPQDYSHGVRLFNAASIDWENPTTGTGTFGQSKLSVVTPNALYLHGDVNTTLTTTTHEGHTVTRPTPMAVFGDSVTLLSKAFKVEDYQNPGLIVTSSPTNITGGGILAPPVGKAGATTTYNTAIVTHNQPTSRASVFEGQAAPFIDTMLFIERWTAAAMNFSGSLVVMDSRRYTQAFLLDAQKSYGRTVLGTTGWHGSSPWNSVAAVTTPAAAAMPARTLSTEWAGSVPAVYAAPNRVYNFNYDLLTAEGTPPFTPFGIISTGIGNWARVVQ